MKHIIASIFVLTAFPAFAVDFSTLLVGTDNKSILECIRLNSDRTKCEQEVDLTLGWLSRFALDIAEDKIPSSEIIKRGMLSEKIKANDKLDLSIDEAKLLKDQIV